jgi:hypothetical protein
LLQKAAFRELYEALDDRSPCKLRFEILDGLTGVCHDLGDWRTAQFFAAELVEAAAATYGIDHPEALLTRHHAALWTGEAGDEQRALNCLRNFSWMKFGFLVQTTPGLWRTDTTSVGWLVSVVTECARWNYQRHYFSIYSGFSDRTILTL